MRFERIYGGKAGIWLKKRRASAQPPNREKEKQHSQHVSDDPADTDTSNDDLERDSGDSFVAENQQESIGWDDILCRPVYKGATYSTIVAEKSETEHEPKGDDETKLKRSRASTTWEGRTSRKKYGARKRFNGLLSRAQLRPKNESRKRKDVDTDVANEKSTSVVRDLDDGSDPNESISVPEAVIASPAPTAETPSVCLSIGREVKEPELIRRISDGAPPSNTSTSTIDEEMHDNQTLALSTLEAKNNETNAVPPLKRRKRASNRPKNVVPETDSVFDFVEETVTQQPSSNTSIETAKAYFENLDNTENLVVDGSSSPLLPSKQCVRTTRLANLASPTLKKEYSRYSAASKESGVEPLSIKEYAVNRDIYFRASEIYDGFSDD